jgi:hypothetical protein
VVYVEGRVAFALLDYDSKGKPAYIVVKDFWAALLKVLPDLSNADRVIRNSTSSGLYRADTGEALPESGGVHIYIRVKDGNDIERFLKALFERTWLAGYGWIMLGTAGQMLERRIVDRMVGASERLVFEAPPILTKPLAQYEERRWPTAVTGEVIDTLAVCPSLTSAKRADFDKLVADAKAAIKPEADKVQAAYIDARADDLVERKGITKEAAVRQIERQCEGVLTGDVN